MTSNNPFAPTSVYPESETVLRDLDETGVLLLTWNRPERHNAWSPEMEATYFGTLIAAANDPAVRVIVVTGAGRAFCPGQDMQLLAASANEGKAANTERRWPMTLARQIPKPVIAVINGACAGIGLIQAISADIRFVASTAKLTTAFARRGLPAENSISWMLPRLVGNGVAADLLLSGRVVLAEEALRIGLVNRMYAPEELLPAALEYARDMAVNCSPMSMAMIKTQQRDDWDRSAEESRLRALVLMSEAPTHSDFAEGVNSYVEKRAPEFQGLDAGLYVPKSINR
jgi:enoyl-CoA hydratase/carnithine racemase